MAGASEQFRLTLLGKSVWNLIREVPRSVIASAAISSGNRVIVFAKLLSGFNEMG
jgi:hypothetical protein